MLYFFYGTDRDKARARARGVIAAMRKKRPDAEYFRVTGDTWQDAQLEEFVSGQGLFERKFVVFADGAFENANAKSWVAANLAGIGTSENAFVFLESSLDAATRKKIEKVAQECREFEAPAKPRRSANSFNIFALADALGARERRKFWSLLSEAFMEGGSPEEINGVLFWQVKSMLAARDARSAAAAGLSPFVYTKSKRYASNYEHEELERLSLALVSIYHDAHRGLTDFPTALERLALSV